MIPRLALDASVRTFDKDGAMHIARTNIAKAGVNPYRGSEIVDWQRLGLLPDKIYNLFRDPEELRKGAATFARKFILSEHVPVPLYDTMEEQELKKLIVGTIGSDIEWDDPFVTADVCIADKQAIVGIDTDTVREFSPSYYYKPVMLSGEYKGEPYDIVMTDIRANHLCLVEEGRQGPDVLAADSALRDTTMKITKFGKALIAALGSLSPKLAADSKFKPLLAEQTRKTFDRAEIRKQLLAMDADMPAENVDAVMDAMLDDEPHPKDCNCKDCKTAKDAEEDETAEEKKKRLAKEKAAEDEDEDETPEEKKKRLAKEKAAEDEDTEKKVKAAMDSMRVEMREANEALKAVAPVVGELAMDSAPDIYAFALDHMKVDRKGVTGTPALRSLFNLANSQKPATPAVAMDTANVVTKFPGAARFRTI